MREDVRPQMLAAHGDAICGRTTSDILPNHAKSPQTYPILSIPFNSLQFLSVPINFSHAYLNSTQSPVRARENTHSSRSAGTERGNWLQVVHHTVRGLPLPLAGLRSNFGSTTTWGRQDICISVYYILITSCIPSVYYILITLSPNDMRQPGSTISFLSLAQSMSSARASLSWHSHNHLMPAFSASSFLNI